ncbi:GNAT family N-acetyltransferase [Zobellella maritima]|uniref:GNAT family N-acetyltransferase n=1 Tax=Zobellella maritima TaxID=2059725 RepID=UPI000E3049D9|nr:GNAT family N-acetyltransferase [Zobellella maritima]
MNSVNIINDKVGWDKALSKCTNYDFYHTWEYHSVSCSNGEGEPILFDTYIGSIGLVFPLLERSIYGSDKKDLTSVYGYPGPLLYGDVNALNIERVWRAFKIFLIESEYVSIFSRCHPLYVDHCLEKYSCCSGKVVIIDLDKPEEEQLRCYRSNHKRGINKLNKMGIVCHFDNSHPRLSDFIDNYNATMQSLAASDSYFFNDAYYSKLIGSKGFSTRLYSCEYNGCVICSGLFMFCGEVVQYHLGGTKPGFNNLSPTKLMFDQVRKDAMALGYRYFCLGGGVGSCEDSLFNFKLGFSKHVENFRLIKIILDECEYRKLTRNIIDSSSFFPLYRAKLSR